MSTIKIDKLQNGLTVASDFMPSVETFSVGIMVKSGSRNENELKINGISHFLEHMAFKGTASRTAKQIAEEFDMIGGMFNAYTSRESTFYYAKVLHADSEVAIDILADILQNSVYSAEEMDRERKVIQEELAQTKDTPDDIVFDYFQEVAYPNQPIGRSILGTEEFLKNVSRDDIVDYVNSRYGCNNIFVTAAGKLDQEKFFCDIEKKFTKLQTNVSTDIQMAKYVGGDKRVEKDLEQVHIVLGFEGLSYLDENYYTQQTLSVLVGGGMSSRLFQEVREKRGLAYGISSFSYSYSDAGIFGVYSSTNEVSANELLDVVIAELDKATKEINLPELIRAKAQVRAGLMMAQESSSYRAEKLANNLAIHNRYLTIQEIMAKIDAITVDDIQEMMKRILYNKSQPTIASIGKIDKLYSYEDVIKKTR